MIDESRIWRLLQTLDDVISKAKARCLGHAQAPSGSDLHHAPHISMLRRSSSAIQDIDSSSLLQTRMQIKSAHSAPTPFDSDRVRQDLRESGIFPLLPQAIGEAAPIEQSLDQEMSLQESAVAGDD